MCCESTVAIVSGHELTPANCRAAGQTRWAFPARNHRGNDDGAAEPVRSVVTYVDYAPGDFMTQNQRKKMARGNAIERKTDVGVTDAAARYFHNHFATLRLEIR
jgi:hypothetical protein